MNPTDILMVTWERLDITEKIIKTIKLNTKPGTYRLHVVDNGSNKHMVGRLRQLVEERYITNLVENNDNKGLEPARNQLLDFAESKFIVTTDSDCLPQRIDAQNGLDWLEKLIGLMEFHPDYGAISCRTQVMIGTGNIFEEADRNGDEIVEFGHPGGSLRIMRSEAVRDVGGWRSDEAGRGSEERYISGKLHEAGWKTGFSSQVKCLHLFGDRRQATDRWGYPADWLPEQTGHSDISHPALTNGDDPDEVKRYTDA